MVTWNWIDFIIVNLSVLDIAISSIASDTSLYGLKVIRTARIIRPMRLLSKSNGLQIAV